MLIKELEVDNCSPEKIGVSYGAGAQRGIIHLGVIKAFIDLKVVPKQLAGASAGSIAATVHAFDPDDTELVNKSIQILKKFKVSDFGFGFIQILARVLAQGTNLQNLGDLDGFAKVARNYLPGKLMEETKVPLGIVATNRLNGQETWFESGAVVDRMVASSSVPGVFPPQWIDGELYVDGSMTDGLPIFHLAKKGCGTIFAVNLGYAGETRKPPKNLVENLMGSLDIQGYQALRYEIELAHALYPKLKVFELRPEVGLNITPSDILKPEIVDQVITQAYEKSLKLIKENL